MDKQIRRLANADFELGATERLEIATRLSRAEDDMDLLASYFVQLVKENKLEKRVESWLAFDIAKDRCAAISVNETGEKTDG